MKTRFNFLKKESAKIGFLSGYKLLTIKNIKL